MKKLKLSAYQKPLLIILSYNKKTQPKTVGLY